MTAFDFQSNVVSSLSNVYLWLFFGYLSAYINCDLQRLLNNNPYMLHIFGIFTFFFLFTLQDRSAQDTEETVRGRNPAIVITQAILVYCIWILAGKLKLFYILGVLTLLMGHQVTLVFLDYFLPLRESRTDGAYTSRLYLTVSTVSAIGVLLAIGVSHYLFIKIVKYKEAFSFKTFFLYREKCKKSYPTYIKDT